MVVTVKLIGIAIEDWDANKRAQVRKWLEEMGYPSGWPRWYFDDQFRCSDLVMNQEIFFMYQAAFGKVEVE